MNCAVEVATISTTIMILITVLAAPASLPTIQNDLEGLLFSFFLYSVLQIFFS